MKKIKKTKQRPLCSVNLYLILRDRSDVNIKGNCVNRNASSRKTVFLLLERTLHADYKKSINFFSSVRYV